MNNKSDGFNFAYEVRKAPGKGLGVFAKEAIKKGSIVWRHVPGQYVVYDEASFTALIEGMNHEEAVYELTHVFGLDDFPDCVIRVLDAGVLFNHDSNCNLTTNLQADRKASPDPAAPGYIEQVTQALLDVRYAMIATQDIKFGDEFTNNYEEEVGDPEFFEVLYAQYDIEDAYLDDG